MFKAYPPQVSFLVYTNPPHSLQFSLLSLQYEYFPQFFRSHEQHISPSLEVVGAGEVVGELPSGPLVGASLFGSVVGPDDVIVILAQFQNCSGAPNKVKRKSIVCKTMNDAIDRLTSN